ncbi:MAG: hypothetical protein IPP44_24595 [Ideonella sp.]|nr:hypothetical protein [Ideonella sp.]
MSATWILVVGLLTLYLGFVVWYGGRGNPLSAQETERFLRVLAERAQGPEAAVLLDEVRALVAKDDGREFVMQNLARYRTRALYPPGQHFGDDPREADRRYGRAIAPHLLRNGCVPLFIARRIGSFIQPVGADDWHYVAMVRYRSRRDFLRFAVAIEAAEISMHKWAALEKTHVFPVRPLLSLVFVRGAVAALLALVGVALAWVIR